MHIKIKSQPEDFVVDEISNLSYSPKGAYHVYSLRKKGLNTFDCLKDISRRHKIVLDHLAYGGRKDRHALTRQFITIQDKRIADEQYDGYSLEWRGRSDRPMGPDLILANSFKIFVRDLSSSTQKNIEERIANIKEFGFPNYFDDQRFGSFNLEHGFLAKKLLSGHLNGALKVYLTFTRDEDRKEDKTRKEHFEKHWKDWRACREKAVSVFEIETFDHLIKSPNDFLLPLKNIPADEMSLFMSAYQSFVWNELLRQILDRHVELTQTYPGVAGDYLFYNKLDKKYMHLELPTLAKKVVIKDEEIKTIYNNILKSEGLTATMFNRLNIRQAFFKSTSRHAVVVPKDISFDFSQDELNKGKLKLNINFELPRGSYATMVLKFIFADNRKK